MTTGEGGAVAINAAGLHRLVESFRDWGRDCWCEPGKDDTCKMRFCQQFGDLPFGFDHKYTYSHIGYNLKATDFQASIGLTQLEKLDRFVEMRRQNYAMLRAGLRDLQETFILPEATPRSDPSPFGFALAVRPEAGFAREDLLKYLERNRIATRLLFGGNLTKQPAYRDAPYRVVGTLDNSDFAMTQVFWIGVWPGLTPDQLNYVIETLHRFVRER
jgi:CDP-6-deoxy-D-xylo-4-hexulose-3-dehydrase